MPRPRSIPENEALERALLVFWDRGFDRTSIADLSEAIGVGPSSIYNAFGSKSALYQQALDHYMDAYCSFAGEILSGSEGRSTHESIRELLHGAVRLYTTKGKPHGCAMLQSGGAGDPADSEACTITLGFKDELEKGLRGFFEAGAEAGDELAMPPRVLAKFVVGSMRGLSQLATDGSSRKDLLRIADHAAASCVLDRK